MASYDLWDLQPTAAKKSKHPSSKRNRKNPLPHPGQSYNPHPNDHQKLLTKVANEELKYERRQKSVTQALRVNITKDEVLEDEKRELEAGITHLIGDRREVKDSDDSETDNAYSDYDNKDFEAIIKDKTVLEKRKTRQQRLNQIKDKLQRKAAKLRKLKNIRSSKFNSIKKIMKELDKKEKEDAKRVKRRKKVNSERLGTKFEESDPIYCLTEDLPSRLGQIRCPMDKIVRQQLESYQSRLMVEPTRPQQKHRKYIKKKYNKTTTADE